MKKALKGVVRPPLIPLVRGYFRYFPVNMGKRFLWERVAGRYFQHADHPFVARTRDGRRIAGNTVDLIQRFIYYFGVWEPALTEWIKRRLKPGDIFVDVGANIGYFTTLASGLVGDQGRVIAVEASPRIFGRLKENLERNGVHNADALNMAVSNKKGKAYVYTAEEGNLGETSIVRQEGRAIETEVDSETLSAILSTYERSKIRMVKIDVEGAESLVVEGMVDILSEHSSMDVFLEINPETLRAHGMTPTGIFEIFERAGYRAYTLENDYSPLTYLAPDRRRGPAPLREPVVARADVLFTKADVENLPT